MSQFGELGVNVGPVGRWLRLLLGILILLFVLTDFVPGTHEHAPGFYWILLLSFVALVLVYTTAHVLLGKRLAGRSAWLGTAIFVIPTMFLIIAPEVDPRMQPGHWLGYPELNHPFRLALITYIGLAFVLQWRDRYGGCEVVSIPNFITRRPYASYCIPLLPLDMFEKWLVGRRS